MLCGHRFCSHSFQDLVAESSESGPGKCLTCRYGVLWAQYINKAMPNECQTRANFVSTFSARPVTGQTTETRECLFASPAPVASDGLVASVAFVASTHCLRWPRCLRCLCGPPLTIHDITVPTCFARVVSGQTRQGQCLFLHYMSGGASYTMTFQLSSAHLSISNYLA
jgi:hypothetical protein